MTLFEKFYLAAGGVAATMVVGYAGAVIAYVAQSDEKTEFTVNEKVVKAGNKSSKYLLMTDNGVFENTDSITRWKWNSSDVYNDIKTGCKYEATVFGFRNNFLSMYQNVVDVQHIPTPACPSPK